MKSQDRSYEDAFYDDDLLDTENDFPALVWIVMAAMAAVAAFLLAPLA